MVHQYGRGPGSGIWTVRLDSPPNSNIRNAILSDRRETQSSTASSPSPSSSRPPRPGTLCLAVLVGTAPHRRRPLQPRSASPADRFSDESPLNLRRLPRRVSAVLRRALLQLWGKLLAARTRSHKSHARVRRLVPFTKRTVARFFMWGGTVTPLSNKTPRSSNTGVASHPSYPSPPGFRGEICAVDYSHCLPSTVLWIGPP